MFRPCHTLCINCLCTLVYQTPCTPSFGKFSCASLVSLSMLTPKIPNAEVMNRSAWPVFLQKHVQCFVFIACGCLCALYYLACRDDDVVERCIHAKKKKSTGQTCKSKMLRACKHSHTFLDRLYICVCKHKEKSCAKRVRITSHTCVPTWHVLISHEHAF